MKILSIHIFRSNQPEPILLASAYAVSFVSVFQRGTLKQFLLFHSRLVISRVQPEQHAEVALERGICYAILNSDKIGVTMICDEEYPKRVAVDLLLKIHGDFKTYCAENSINVNAYVKDEELSYKYIETLIEEWQDPSKKDNLMKLQSELNDVKDIMQQNLNELLNRGENLDALMEKSKDLSSTSVTFYKQAKKTNSCCNL